MNRARKIALRDARHALHAASEHLVEALEWAAEDRIAEDSVAYAIKELASAAEALGLRVVQEKQAA